MFISKSRPDCIFNIGDHVMLDNIMKGVVVQTQYSDIVRSNNKPIGWIISVKSYYFWSRRQNIDLGDSMGIMTHRESDLEFDPLELRNKKLNQLGI